MTTASGKTTVGAGIKFMLKVSQSSKRLHIIAARTTGIAEKNILQQDNGILDLHRNASYNGNGSREFRIPHIQFEDKIIFILGYNSREKWEYALGGQYGAVMIDEINRANIDFVREISTRNEYMLATLNPDDPGLPVYKEFINRSRPFPKYRQDVPQEILRELTEPAVDGWHYWFFSFRDNASLTPEEIERKKQSAPIGTKLYKNKILGLRGKATGLVFSNFEPSIHVISKDKAKQIIQADPIRIYSAGLDTAYSSQSPDTIALSFIGITQSGKLLVLDERVYNNANLDIPLAASDTVINSIDFLERNRKTWDLSRNIFIDSADQATIQEFKKYKRNNPTIYVPENAWKKLPIIDRITHQLNWLHHNETKEPDMYVLDHCRNYITELQTYSWQEDKDNKPEDGHDHMINSVQYAFLPYISRIGTNNTD